MSVWLVCHHRMMLRFGAFHLVLAFFPYCALPKTVHVESDMMQLPEGTDGYVIAPTRIDTDPNQGFTSPTSTKVSCKCNALNGSEQHICGSVHVLLVLWTVRSVLSATTTADVASQRVPPGKQAGTLFEQLPVPLFTFIAALARCEPFRQDVFNSGLLQACVDRFVLETSNPNTDLKVQAELAMLFTRFAGRCFPGFGSANDTLLSKQRTCTPDQMGRYESLSLVVCFE